MPTLGLRIRCVFDLQPTIAAISVDGLLPFSAGASERLSEDPRYAGGLNCFAREALSRNLGPPQDAQFDEVVQLAQAHRSKGSSRFRGQRFDLLVFARLPARPCDKPSHARHC